MSENHSANRKDDRADPNGDGGLLLGDVVRRFHSQVTAALPSRPHGTDCCININYANPDLAAGYAGGCFYVISKVVDQAGLSIPPPSIMLLASSSASSSL
jgi:hypothetical protein